MEGGEPEPEPEAVDTVNSESEAEGQRGAGAEAEDDGAEETLGSSRSLAASEADSSRSLAASEADSSRSLAASETESDAETETVTQRAAGSFGMLMQGAERLHKTGALLTGAAPVVDFKSDEFHDAVRASRFPLSSYDTDKCTLVAQDLAGGNAYLSMSQGASSGALGSYKTQQVSDTDPYRSVACTDLISPRATGRSGTSA